jgi:hypothetical protein
MKRSLLPRTMSKLSESTYRRLNAYELAATAAGVGMLALVPPSEAKIVYTHAHRVIKRGMSYKLDLNHDGVVDFTLRNPTYRVGASLSAEPAAGNGASGFSNIFASALRRGALIGTRRYFPGKAMVWVGTSGDGVSVSYGSWINVKNRYLGLKFKIGGKAHYGWARLSVQVHNYPASITATLTGYAYETVAHKPIRAGQIKEADDLTAGLDSVNPGRSSSGASIVESPGDITRSGSLGSLALGAAGFK